MEIIIGQKFPVQNEQSNLVAPARPGGGLSHKEQRKNKQDRRQEVRDGIIVSLSIMNDRRKSKGRRKTDYYAMV